MFSKFARVAAALAMAALVCACSTEQSRQKMMTEFADARSRCNTKELSSCADYQALLQKCAESCATAQQMQFRTAEYQLESMARGSRMPGGASLEGMLTSLASMAAQTECNDCRSAQASAIGLADSR